MIFKKKKKQKDSSQNMKDVSSSQIKIKVYMSFGSGVPICTNEFFAEQKQDGLGGFDFVNDAKGFRQPVDFQMDDIYREMQVILRINEMPVPKQLELLEKKIQKQKKTLAYLETHIDLNALFNYADEKLKLRDYEILYNHIKYIGNQTGSFFTLEDGKRVYHFFKLDGFFIPIFWGADEQTNYPDHVPKKKIYVNEEITFNNQWGNRFKDKVSTGSLVTVLVILVVLTLALLYGLKYVSDKSTNLDEQANAAALQCAEQTARLQGDIQELLSMEVVRKAIDNSPKNYSELYRDRSVKELDPS